MATKKKSAKTVKKSPTKKATTKKGIKKKLSKSIAGKGSNSRTWKQFEKLMASIHKQLDPKAEVQHNQEVVGVSGVRRQLDVAITGVVANYPVLVVIECKQYKKRVGIEKVEAFSRKRRDVKASLGVMISPMGFTDGAKKIAAQDGIILKTFRRAEETDWREFLNEDSWLALTITDVSNLRAYIRVADESNELEIPVTTEITIDGQKNSLESIFRNWYESKKPLPSIGPTRVSVDFPDGASIIRFPDQPPSQVSEMLFFCHITARKYLITKLLGGEVLEKISENQEGVSEGITFIIDKVDIIKNQPGIELTAQEYEQDRAILMQQLIDITTRYSKVGIFKTQDE